MRFENIGDLFDNITLGEHAMHVDIVSFVYEFWFEANYEHDPFGKQCLMTQGKTVRECWSSGYTSIPLVDITEVDLTNNQAAGNNNTNIWYGVDDHLITETSPFDPVYSSPSSPLDTPILK